MSARELDPDGELRGLAGDCVHCGFCLPACPTYQLWGEEMDSPRGRIHLITQILDGQPATATAAAHLDRCLGCMACVPACPSGVRYDRLIEAAREWAEDATEPDPAAQATPGTAGASGTASGLGATVAGADGTNGADGTSGKAGLRGATAAAEVQSADAAGSADADPAHAGAPYADAPYAGADSAGSSFAAAGPATADPGTADPATADPADAPVAGEAWVGEAWTSAGAARQAPAPPAANRALPARSRRDRAVRRAIFETFPYPQRLRVLIAPLRVAQRAGADRLLARSDLVARLAPELAAALRVAPPPAPRTASTGTPGRARAGARRPRLTRTGTPGRVAGLPERIPARGERRAVVGMLTGCVQQVFFPDVNAATARVLAAEGCDVIVARGQGCCGALSMHGGRRAEAAGFARRTIEAFEQAGVDTVVVNAAGCGSAMKEYGQLLSDDPDWAARAAALGAKVADFSEFLAGLGAAAPRHPLPLTAVYQDACHLGHAQGITRQPRELLAAIPGLRLAEIGDGGTCCGSAGIYNLVQPEAATALGARKAQSVWGAGGELLVSANPGCAMQIAAALRAQGTPMPVAHVAQVLDASLRGLPASALLG
jgi:glycolate oxidase iron-sulfur subunit